MPDMRVWHIVDGYSAALFGRYIKGITEYDEILATTLDSEVWRYTAEPEARSISMAAVTPGDRLLLVAP